MSRYFKNIEENMNEAFLLKLDEARAYANIPFVINSAFRSYEDNIRAGGSENSSHLRGLAVDISARDSTTRFLVLDALLAVGFVRIGVGSTFIHVDVDTEKDDSVIWTY